MFSADSISPRQPCSRTENPLLQMQAGNARNHRFWTLTIGLLYSSIPATGFVLGTKLNHRLSTKFPQRLQVVAALGTWASLAAMGLVNQLYPIPKNKN